MKRTITVYADPGHAWGKVSFEQLKDVGMNAEDFSSFSYLRGGHIYLEEDSDLSKFAKAFKEKHGVDLRFNERHANSQSRVRHYWPNNAQGRDYAARGLI